MCRRDREGTTLLAWEEYPKYRFATRRPGRVEHDELTSFLNRFAEADSQVSVDLLGQSYLQRDIAVVRVGLGPTKIVMWAQMHGNEPTHAVVLCELLQFLSDANSVAAKNILDRCQLTIVPMLNPDGAELWTRQNAQSIDINRDARQLAAPESRLLWQLTQSEDFDFALNLHNQRPARTINGRDLAAVSLLVPPLNESNAETESTVRAKKLASCVRDAIDQIRPENISRYAAGYMPTCFGEAVQASGIGTLLIEAGACPERDSDWLTRLHFHGLVSGLTAIANAEFAGRETEPYESLPISNDDDLFDVLIRSANLVPSKPLNVASTHQNSDDRVDIGIMRTLDRMGRNLQGAMEQVGDLNGRSGRQVVDAVGLHAVPGRISIELSLKPNQSDVQSELDKAAKSGVTTLIGFYVGSDDEQTKSVSQFANTYRLPLDVAWLCVDLDSLSGTAGAALLADTTSAEAALKCLRRATRASAWVIVGDAAPDSPVETTCGTHQLKDSSALDWLVAEMSTTGKLASVVGQPACWPRLGDVAHMMLVADGQSAAVVHSWVNGEPVMVDGQLMENSPGRVLRCVADLLI